MFFQNMDPLALSVYHDIKNKLGSLKFTATLLKNNLDPTERNRLIDNLIASIDQMIAITTDFINYYRFKEKKYLPQETIDLKELITEILAELKNDLQAKQITYTIVSEKEHPLIKSNRYWLKTALYNILHNAIKYNKFGGKIFVTIKAFPSGYMLAIEDTGKGMDQNEIEKVFKKYFTKHSDELGTGLGMTFSKKIIESFGGQILLRSRPKEGSTFFIFIPKISRQMKKRYFYASLASMFVAGFIALDYYYCLIPQNIEVIKGKDKVVYRLENGAIARLGKKDRFELEAYKNLFGTRTRTEIKLQKADLYLTTASNPIKVYAGPVQLQNRGTEFEVVSKEQRSAVSVYKGEVQSPRATIGEKRGLIADPKGEKVAHLPPEVQDVRYHSSPERTELVWKSPERAFRLTFAKDANITIDLRTVHTSKPSYRIYDIPDGRWYVQIQALRDDLFSPPVTVSIVTLIDYYRALKEYKSGDKALAKAFLQRSLESIEGSDYRPYLLYGQLLLEEGQYEKALPYLKNAYALHPSPQTAKALIKALFHLKKYDQIPQIAKSLTQLDLQMHYYLGMSYYHLGQKQQAAEHLWKVLEADPKNIEVIETLEHISDDATTKEVLRHMKEEIDAAH